MQMNEQRVAIVTGANKGLGLAVAENFVKEGKKVVFVIRNKANLEQTRQRFQQEELQKQVMFIQLDVSDINGIKSAVNEVLNEWGRIDILVNNAGIRFETPIEEIDEEEWDQVLSVNLKSTFFFSQAVIPAMKERGWGRIINMSSIGGQAGPLTSGAHYSASKAGQIALSKVFARSLAPYGITVNTVAPAAIRTPEMDKMDPAKLAQMVETIPLRRVGEPREVSDLVSYLASDTGGFTTGATFDINGGRLMR
ncbi:NAD(P)-dependent dehydrogenase (short-subunit alcohol dehydrogenase family) [Neobacillus niacini]|jgi:NAD(P)-dependent dehydrogenase (short-subunit alcohol dehydrogenase family)|uniref:SDR family NAD(P)-dependent oxidoreductase n=1 Tax=Neobacillus niacini TaxID=86668 RepID=UPI00277E8EFA|nr:SDR family NAD(P)-dependent oxidoreductase [Neobacillus niacini]MDQ1003534.1 NAD(P)-dependent dehydrogenase (short-subunit alcohol dehydrogenase family) [Neobacillus niacini]